MNSSLPKRRPNAQKENLSRLSNSKIVTAYSGGNLPKSYASDSLQPFLSSSIEEKMRTNSKRIARLKTGRKHQLSAEFILASKAKEPYSVRSPHPELKTKQKKKKKQKSSNESSKFIIPVGEFSKSNSLIVFSEKDSTIGANLFGKDKQLYFTQKYTPTQAAVIIQKTWRGYLTRKLLDQYITDEESKINSVIKKIRSKEDSFMMEEEIENDVNFLSFSSINEGTTNINELRKHSMQNDEEDTNVKYFVMHTTSQETNSKEAQRCQSSLQYRSFFKSHKTEPDSNNLQSKIIESPSILNHDVKSKLTLSSSLYNYSFFNKFQEDKIIQYLRNEPLNVKIDRVGEDIEACYQECRKCLKNSLQNNELELDQMIARNSKLKEIFENSLQFINDVLQQITAILDDMHSVTQNGIYSNHSSPSHHEPPKSQVFTIDIDEQCPQPCKIPQFRQGQVKLQQYLSEIVEEYHQNGQGTSQLQFLCEVLKVNSERGVRNIVQRCLIQFTVQIITESIPLAELQKHIYKTNLGHTKEERFIEKWVQQIGKWEMGTIQEVTQAMESSSFINPDISNLSDK